MAENVPLQGGGLTFDPATGQISGGLQKKRVPTLSEILAQTFGEGGAANAFRPSEALLSRIETSTAPTQGLGADYFSNIQQQATERLRRQFFDEGGVQSQVAENLASRGLVGSGVEQDIFREQVFEPFSQGAGDIASDIAAQQAQSGVETERFNRQLGLQGAGLLSDIEGRFQQLGTQLALAEQGRLDTEAERDLQRQLQEIELQINAFGQSQANELARGQFTADLIGQLGNADISPQARLQLEDIYNSQMGGGAGGETTSLIDNAYRPGFAQMSPTATTPSGAIFDIYDRINKGEISGGGQYAGQGSPAFNQLLAQLEAENPGMDQFRIINNALIRFQGG